MLNEKYIFWETEIVLRIGGVRLYGSFSEWGQLNSQLNQGIALNSEQPLTDEEIKAILASDKATFYPPNEDRRYISGMCIRKPPTSFFQSMWELGQHIAEILRDKKLPWRNHYDTEPEIVRRPHVWHREKEGKVELLTHEQKEAGILNREYDWMPVLLLAVLRDHWDKLPSDLFLPDEDNHTPEELEREREMLNMSRGISFFRPLNVVLRQGEGK